MHLDQFKTYIKDKNFFNIDLIKELKETEDLESLFIKFNHKVENNILMNIPKEFKFTFRIFLSYIIYLLDKKISYDSCEYKFLEKINSLRIEAINKLIEPNLMYENNLSTQIIFNDLSSYMISNNLLLPLITVLNHNSQLNVNFSILSEFIESNSDKFSNEEIILIFENNIYKNKMLINIFKCPDFLMKLPFEKLKEIMMINSHSYNFTELIYSSKDALRYIMREFDFNKYTKSYINLLADLLINNQNVNFKDQYYMLNTINKRVNSSFFIENANKQKKETIYASIFICFFDNLFSKNSLINENDDQKIGMEYFLSSNNFKSLNDNIKDLIIDNLAEKIINFNSFTHINMTNRNYFLLLNNLDINNKDEHFHKFIFTFLKNEKVYKTIDFIEFSKNSFLNNQNFFLKIYEDRYFKNSKIKINIPFNDQIEGEKIYRLAFLRDEINAKKHEEYLDIEHLNRQIEKIILKSLSFQEKKIKKKRI